MGEFLIKGCVGFDGVVCDVGLGIVWEGDGGVGWRYLGGWGESLVLGGDNVVINCVVNL